MGTCAGAGVTPAETTGKVQGRSPVLPSSPLCLLPLIGWRPPSGPHSEASPAQKQGALEKQRAERVPLGSEAARKVNIRGTPSKDGMATCSLGCNLPVEVSAVRVWWSSQRRSSITPSKEAITHTSNSLATVEDLRSMTILRLTPIVSGPSYFPNYLFFASLHHCGRSLISSITK